MNYSDYDSENYSSDEDEDYVPSDDNLSEDDINECEKEEGLDVDDDGKQSSEDVKKKKKKISKDIGVRKRKKIGLQLEGEEDGDGAQEEESDQEKQAEEEEEEGGDEEGGAVPNAKEEKEKKKADDLWASFLSDVGPRPKTSAPTSASVSASAQSAKSPQVPAKSPQTAVADNTNKPDVPPSAPQDPEPKSKQPTKITITKIFDFAGEEVRVTKEVEADSKEAKSFLKIKEKEGTDQPCQKQPSAPSLTPGPRYLICERVWRAGFPHSSLSCRSAVLKVIAHPHNCTHLKNSFLHEQ
ncbi:hypothetical protein JZ751_029987 [Albula glossodonta]|uniref:Craniofacial development protein 1 n=1 Tax=Albula glossodonta TaxID=121402 RepID=A0A8T2N9H5_9TELE|nr:hypothetical protein JZ751_029987 [Albula glossodonta]